MNKQIVVHSAFGFTGYGIAGYNIVKSLMDINYDAYIFPIVFNRLGPSFSLESEEANQEFADIFRKFETGSFDPKSPCLKIWHQFDLLDRIGKGEYIAFPFFEIDKFKQNEIVHLNVPDKLVVASHWAKDILATNNITVPTYVAPLGVDTKIFDSNLCRAKKDDAPYVFINIGKWEIRKGHDILPEIFNAAFDEKDNVELWILGSSAEGLFSLQELNDWHSYYQGTKLTDKIKIFPRLKTQNEVAHVISQADCGIFMARAEGWNLDLLEVMSMGKPVITTNYSAHTEFCNKDNSHLVDIPLTEDAYDGKWFNGFGQWAKIGQNEKDQAIEYMRYLYRNNIRTNPAGIETGQYFSWNNTATKIVECID